MIYTIQCFAGIAELTGQASVAVDIPEESITVAELKQVLIERFPEGAHAFQRAFMAVNQAYAPDDVIIYPSDELALIPPVSGGEATSKPAVSTDATSKDGRYVLTYEVIVTDKVAQHVAHPDHGATLIFTGTTREHTNGTRTLHLEYEAYTPMALKKMEQIGQEISERWPGTLTAITHRLGTVPIGEASVVIAVSASHRPACYEASRYAIDRLKQIVPIWKKEVWEDRSEWMGEQPGTVWNPFINE